MHVDPIIPMLCAVVTVVLALVITLRRFHQPRVVACTLAGVLVTYSRQATWIREQLAPFRDLLVGAFFVSIGMMIRVDYLVTQWRIITVLVVAVLLTNTIINALIIRALGRSWHESWFAGALLAQVGELSFLLAAVGVRSGMITSFACQATVVTIALTLTLSPLWILVIGRASRRSSRGGGSSPASPPPPPP